MGTSIFWKNFSKTLKLFLPGIALMGLGLFSLYQETYVYSQWIKATGTIDQLEITQSGEDPSYTYSILYNVGPQQFHVSQSLSGKPPFTQDSAVLILVDPTDYHHHRFDDPKGAWSFFWFTQLLGGALIVSSIYLLKRKIARAKRWEEKFADEASSVEPTLKATVERRRKDRL